MSSFAETQSRDVQEVRGIGFGDQIAEVVPNVMTAPTIAVTRTAMYLENIYQVFGYFAGVDGLVRALKHHKWPFDIKSELIFSDIANLESYGSQVVRSSDQCHLAIITIYEACWITNFTRTAASDTTVMNEDVDITVSDIVDGKNLYHECIETGNKLKSGRFAGFFVAGAFAPTILTPTGV